MRVRAVGSVGRRGCSRGNSRGERGGGHSWSRPQTRSTRGKAPLCVEGRCVVRHRAIQGNEQPVRVGASPEVHRNKRSYTGKQGPPGPRWCGVCITQYGLTLRRLTSCLCVNGSPAIGARIGSRHSLAKWLLHKKDCWCLRASHCLCGLMATFAHCTIRN